MRTEIQSRSAGDSFPVTRRTVLAVLAVSVTQSASVWSQTTPNWGAGAASPVPSGASSTSAWGGARTPTPEAPQGSTTLHSRSDRAPPKGRAVPPALAAVLQRPDTDTVTLPNGERATVAADPG